MTPCNNKSCNHYQELDYENGTLTYEFERDAVLNYSANRKADKMYVVRATPIYCPMCKDFKGMDLNTTPKKVAKPKAAKKKGK